MLLGDGHCLNKSIINNLLSWSKAARFNHAMIADEEAAGKSLISASNLEQNSIRTHGK
jgi:hypothetical protein